METTLLVVAIVAGAIWLGLVLFATVEGSLARGRGDDDGAVAFARTHARLGRWGAIPAALVALVAGIAWARAAERSVEPDWWLGTALGAWVVAFTGSTLWRGALLDRAVARADELGPSEEDVRWRIRQVTFTLRGELLLLSVAAVVVLVAPTG